LDAARACAPDEIEARRHEQNARALLTHWGGPFLFDYATREWAGLTLDFHLERWQLWFDGYRDFATWEREWAESVRIPKESAPADEIETVKRMLSKYGDFDLQADLPLRVRRLEPKPVLEGSVFVDLGKATTLTAVACCPIFGQGFRGRYALEVSENGSAWSPRAQFDAGLGCVQSVEVTPGTYRLLMSGTGNGPILQRDKSVNNDNGALYPAWTKFGTIVLAQPGQLAALFFITLESMRVGTRPSLALLLGELEGTYDPLNRTRQDPTNLPPSQSIYSDRYHFAQNQKEAWCRWFVMKVSWPEEDAPNELLTFTIFGQNWQEMRAQ